MGDQQYGDPHKPLTQTDYQHINHALARLNDLTRALDLAEAAGMNVSELRLRAQHQVAKLSAIKQAYFPNKP